jgi:signal transduction histidine kinase
MKKKIGTVRAKLTVLATVLVAAMLSASAVGLVVIQFRVLTHAIDESLIQRADNIQVAVLDGTMDARLPTEGDPEDLFLQLLGPNGEVVASSANAAALPAAATPPVAGEREAITSVSGIRLSNGEFRVLVRRLNSDEAAFLVVGKNLDDVEESVDVLATSLAIAIPLVTVLLGLLVWWLTGRALRPVEAIRAEVADIGGDQLHRRVPDPQTDDEIGQLARTMNDMLWRVEHATERQRRFVADASHELRGPLTRLRSNLEVALVQPAAVTREDLLTGLLGDVADLQKLVEDLLFLARSEAGTHAVPDTPVDLDDIVLDEAKRLRDRGNVQVDVSQVSAARTSGDGGQLVRAVRNLASNAERHAASVVTFELREQDGRCELVVADDGPGIASNDREEVFKRFTRLDEARSRDHGGAGLGLAIVQDIMTRHAGDVHITSATPTGARFVVHLPRTG